MRNTLFMTKALAEQHLVLLVLSLRLLGAAAAAYLVLCMLTEQAQGSYSQPELSRMGELPYANSQADELVTGNLQGARCISRHACIRRLA